MLYISHCYLPTPQATHHQIKTQDQCTYQGTLSLHVTLAHFLFVFVFCLTYCLSLSLPTDVPKRLLPSAILLTTMSLIIALTHRSTTLMLLTMTDPLMLHITPPTELIHPVTRKRSHYKTKPANIRPSNSSAINLSSCSLSTDKISVLSYGLKFCLIPQHINWLEVSAVIYNFSR